MSDTGTGQGDGGEPRNGGVRAYDVFLSHNSEDKPRVRELGRALKDRGLDVWLDEEQLRPGVPWQQELEEGIKSSSSVAVLVGNDGLGPWEDEEMRAALNLAVRDGRPVIPVLLPEAPKEPELPLFLSNRTWVDLREGLTAQGLDRLEWGITGKQPQSHAPGPSPEPSDPSRPRRRSPPRVSPERLPRTRARALVGREEELARLHQAWQAALRQETPRAHLISITAWGGVGKTALVTHWLDQLMASDWAGAEKVFEWSFYSQGTRERGGPSADTFVKEALTFFGDPDMAESAKSASDKGARLARLVSESRSLLVLDGLEPLQYPPGPQAGELKDPALKALVTGLARSVTQGLCVLTTRESMADLGRYTSTAHECELERLSEPAGALLLENLGVRGTKSEREQASREVQGHALTLELLGSYLVRAHAGDVRQRDRVRLEEADAKVQGGHAFKVMAAYERWLASGPERGTEQLALLRVLGLFDRPADPGCLGALRQAPAIADLTEPLVGLGEADYRLVVSDLVEAGLVKTTACEPVSVTGYSQEQAKKPRDERGEPRHFEPPDTLGLEAASVLDVHPLVREYFGCQVREEHSDAFRAGHERLFEHLQRSVPYWPEGVEGLGPLYQAVAHGCQAGLYQDACDRVYRERIVRGHEFYSRQELGAVAADLGAVEWFFEEPWKRVSSSLREAAQSWLLNEAALDLRALGRLGEAVEPTRTALDMAVAEDDRRHAAVGASNLSQLELALGQLERARGHANQAVEYADRSGDAFQRMGNRTTLADALHQAGERDQALRLFEQAEAMQIERQPQYPLLYSLQGFWYSDLLLAEAERAAWLGRLDEELARACEAVVHRVSQTLAWAERYLGPGAVALDHLTLGRAELCRSILGPVAQGAREKATRELDAAVNGLRAAGSADHIPRGLLSRAWLRTLQGDERGARADLDEAWELAERGPMPLFLADVHLCRARLFGDTRELEAARKLIVEHGYGRRMGELEDAERQRGRGPQPT